MKYTNKNNLLLKPLNIAAEKRPPPNITINHIG